MPSREALVICARSIAHNYKGVQPDGSFPSWETLKAVYDQAMATPPDWAIHNGATLRPSNGPLASPRTASRAERPTKSSAFRGAAFSRRMSCSAGIPVKWQTYAGITPRQPYLEKLSGFGNWAGHPMRRHLHPR